MNEKKREIKGKIIAKRRKFPDLILKIINKTN